MVDLFLSFFLCVFSPSLQGNAASDKRIFPQDNPASSASLQYSYVRVEQLLTKRAGKMDWKGGQVPSTRLQKHHKKAYSLACESQREGSGQKASARSLNIHSD